MAVSANTLFHFSSERSLKGILQSQAFWPQYSLERFHGALPRTSPFIRSWIPMVCFCDLKLTVLSDDSISKHTSHFGEFGIGLEKSWGIRNGISPVSYIHDSSVAAQTVDRIIKSVNDVEESEQTPLAEQLGEIVKFLKPYKGYYQKGKRQSSPITYYDEREWRYSPNNQKSAVYSYLKLEEKQISQLNETLRKTSLKFNPSEVKYLLVPSEKDKISLARFIRNNTTGMENQDLLISVIMSFDEIREDF